jgi:hypothetical protein
MRHITRLRWRKTWSVLTVIVMQSSCTSSFYREHRPTSLEEAAGLNLAVLQVARWEDYIAPLSPAFSITGETALAKSLPVTSFSEERILDALAGSLSVGLRREGTVDTKTTKTTTKTDPADVTTNEREIIDEEKITQGPGDAPANPPTISNSLAPLPARANQALHPDPFLHYNAASALLQEVQLLNHAVQDAALRRDMDAYVVRLQLQALPYARNQPFDLYALLGFFGTGKPNEAEPTPEYLAKDKQAFILPLLVTDNLEQTVADRSRQTIRDLSLAVSALESGTLASLGLSRKMERLNAVLASDANSLLTVGRPADNTLSVRLGAAKQSTAEFAMLPRTHNVTLVVMVKKESEVRNIRVAGFWSLRDVKTGQLLPSAPPGEAHIDLLSAVKKSFPESTTKNLTPECLNKLVTALYANSFRTYRTLIREQHDPAGNATCMELPFGVYRRDVWLFLVDQLQRRPALGALFNLPYPVTPRLPPEQAVFLVDNKKTATIAQLLNGSDLNNSKFAATLKVKLKGAPNSLSLLAEKVTVSNDGAGVALSFPSLHQWGLNNVEKTANQLTGANIELIENRSTRWQKANPQSTTYSAVYYQKIEATPEKLIAVAQKWVANKPLRRLYLPPKVRILRAPKFFREIQRPCLLQTAKFN